MALQPRAVLCPCLRACGDADVTLPCCRVPSQLTSSIRNYNSQLDRLVTNLKEDLEDEDMTETLCVACRACGRCAGHAASRGVALRDVARRARVSAEHQRS
jgi:hypothetical protein